MTGWLAIVGVIVVLMAGAYTGLSASSESEGKTADGPAATATSQALEPVQVNVETPTPTVGAPTATPTTVLNRGNCDAIRGTPYHSPAERTWYLANCVNH